jgi:hypothetical protein
MTKIATCANFDVFTVSVDTVPVEGRLVVWQISVHIPSLPDTEVGS